MALVFHYPLGYWSTLVERLQTSPLECYAAIDFHSPPPGPANP
jgi:hypothetical protein